MIRTKISDPSEITVGEGASKEPINHCQSEFIGSSDAP